MPFVTRDELIEEIHDTKHYYETELVLIEAVKSTNERTKVYPVDFAEEVDVKIAALNFAASTKPGGGVWHGSYAQTEGFYNYHRGNCG